MTPSYLLIIVGILVTWRATHLFVNESGPWDIFGRLRRAAGSGLFAELIVCFYCLSLWIAPPLAFMLAPTWRHRLLLWPALSGGAILLHRLSERTQPASPPIFFEDKPTPQEDSDVLRS